MIEKDLFITQNSYYFVHRHFLCFFEKKNTEVIFVSENKRGISKKYIEIVKTFGLYNFFKCLFFEAVFLVILKKRTESLKAFKVSDNNLNKFLKGLLKRNSYKRIISIGCPCLINTSFENYNYPIYNIHGGIMPFQKGRYSPLTSLKKGDLYLGATIHEIDENFDEGKIISQDFFEINNKEKLLNYNRVLNIASELLNKFIYEKYIKLPNKIYLYFNKR